MTPLCEIALKYHCDKVLRHSYTPVYYELFEGMHVRRLLEIGIGTEDLMKPFVDVYVHGASLWLWQEFFLEADIFACDIREDVLINEGRIRSYWCDQRSVESLQALLKQTGRNFDVIIDDGSHVTEDQITSAKVLVPTLALGGVYVVEDCWHPELILPLFPDHQCAEYRGNKTCDDILAIIRRPEWIV